MQHIRVNVRVEWKGVEWSGKGWSRVERGGVEWKGWREELFHL